LAIYTTTKWSLRWISSRKRSCRGYS